MKHFSISSLVLLGISAMLAITSCEDGSGDSTVVSDGSGGRAVVSASMVPKRAATDIRDSYVLFSISANRLVTDYHLAVKASSKAPPTAEEMASGALKRNLGTNAINVLIAQRLNAPMVAFAEKFFEDKTHTTLGNDMQITVDTRVHFALVRDNTASGSDAWVAQSVLEPSTEYTLYGMESGGGSVTELLSMSTDAESSETGSRSVSEVKMEYMDTTLENKYIDIVLNPDEIYIFPLQNKISFPGSNSLETANFYYSTAGNTLDMTDLELFGSAQRNTAYQLLLSADKDTHIETVSRGIYALLYTKEIHLESGTAPRFAVGYALSSNSPPSAMLFSQLMGLLPQKGVPADPPAAVWAATTAENTITITWKTPYAGYALVNNEWVGEITGYNIYRSESNIAESTDLTALNLVETVGSPVAVSGLNGGTEYFFAVQTVSSAGESALSEVMRITANTPGPPKEVHLTPNSSMEVIVSWMAPDNTGYYDDGTTVTAGTISGYRIYYYFKSPITASTDLTTLAPIEASNSPFSITGLGDLTGYFFAVTAINETGEGPISSGGAFTTN